MEVAFAMPCKQKIEIVMVNPGTTALEAVIKAGLHRFFENFPDIEAFSLGIFGKIVSGDTVLKPGDRVEIYRPLALDPKAARRARAEKNRNRQF